MDLPIEQKTKLFFCYKLTQDWLESLRYDLGNDFVHHMTAGNRSKFLKGFSFLFFWYEGDECGIHGP